LVVISSYPVNVSAGVNRLSLSFDSAATASIAPIAASDPGTGGATSSTSNTGLGTTVNMFSIDFSTMPSCDLSQLALLDVSSTYTKSSGLDTAQDGGLIGVTTSASSLSAWGSLNTSSGSSNGANGLIADHTSDGGSVDTSPSSLSGTWSDSAVPTPNLWVYVISDTTNSSSGTTASISLPEILVSWQPGSACGPLALADLEVTSTSLTNGPILADQNLTYTLTVTNNGPGIQRHRNGELYYYVLIPANTEFISAEQNQSPSSCYIGPAVQDFGPAFATYTGTMMLCGGIGFGPIEPSTSTTLTINLKATTDFTDGVEVFRVLAAAEDGKEPDSSLLEPAFEASSPFFDTVGLNNIATTTYRYTSSTPNTGTGTNAKAPNTGVGSKMYGYAAPAVAALFSIVFLARNRLKHAIIKPPSKIK
jgi:hypothetical protein